MTDTVNKTDTINKKIFVAAPDKYFYTIDKKILTNIHQLSEYLKSCPESSFHYHASPLRNDFYNWLLYVFGLSELADKIKNNYDKNDCANIISDYINKLEKQHLSQENQYTNNYDINKHDINNKNVGDSETQGNINESNNASIIKSNNESISGKENVKKEEPMEKTKHVSQISEKVLEDSSKDNKFHEFSDEELERFTKFGVKDTETPVDEKLDYLKTELNEVRNMIKEQRRLGKDMLIADLMLRVVEPKISFYEFTRNHEDYEKIVRIMSDIKREIDYASQQTEVTLADEIIKQLELQSILLKKDFTQQKQGIKGALGKIFKPANQEV